MTSNISVAELSGGMKKTVSKRDATSPTQKEKNAAILNANANKGKVV